MKRLAEDFLACFIAMFLFFGATTVAIIIAETYGRGYGVALGGAFYAILYWMIRD